MHCLAMIAQCHILVASAGILCAILSALVTTFWIRRKVGRLACEKEQPRAKLLEGRKPHPHYLPALQHDNELCVEVSTLLGKGRSSYIFRGKWEGAHVAVKVARVPIKVQQHAEGVQPTPVTPYCCQVAHPNLVDLYAYKWTVVTWETNFVSGCLRTPGSSMPVSLRQALQLAGASTNSCAREEKHEELLEVITVSELCLDGMLRDYIDILCNVGSCPISCAPSCEGQGLPSPAPSERDLSHLHLDQASLDGDCASVGGGIDEVELMPEEAASMRHDSLQNEARLAMAVEVEKCADGLLASTDCDLPDNFIHFTGSSKPSQEHDSDSELALKLNTLLEVGRGLAFLHASGIVHGNLSASSVLLKNSTLDRRGFVAKIGHWGGSRAPSPSQGSRSHAPASATPADDVYAFGALMVELVTGKCPDSSDGQAVILEFVRHSLPPAYKLLVKQCLAFDPAFRPTMAQVVYSMGVLEEQLRETCSLSEVDILFSMFNDQGPPTPPVVKRVPQRWLQGSPTSPPGSPHASPEGSHAVLADLASIDALFKRPLRTMSMPQANWLLHPSAPAKTPLQNGLKKRH